QALAAFSLGDSPQRSPPDEILFIELHDPGHSSLERIRERVGIDSDDHVPLFETQQPLRFDAERTDAELLTGFEQRAPEMLAIFGRDVDLPPGLADKADSQQRRRRTRAFRLAPRHVRKSFRIEIA